MTDLVLSLFPGVGLLDRAFEEKNFCVVRGPDLLWGGDIRNFHPPANTFTGIIGGPPCQDFSGLRRIPATGYGLEMLEQFARCVTEAQPEWWLIENVARVPTVTDQSHPYAKKIRAGYVTQRFDINAGWYCDQTRLRHIQFGSLSGRLLNVTRRSVTGIKHGAALANDDRSFTQLCRLQGLPDDFDLPGFTVKEAKRAVGNGVPLIMGRALAQAVVEAYKCDQPGLSRLCVNDCGRPVTGKALYCGQTCRKQAQRKRDLAGSRHTSVTELSHATLGVE